MNTVIETANLSEPYKAVRLIVKGLEPKLSAAADNEYAALIAHWDADPEFRTLVHSLASAMELSIVDVTARKIMLRPVHEASLFATRMSDVRGSASDLTRGLLAIVMIGIGAAFFRDGGSLAGIDDQRTELSADNIEQIITDICERIADRQTVDPEFCPGEINKAWRRWNELSPRGAGSDRPGTNSRLGLVRIALKHFVDQDMMIEAQAGTSTTYVPTDRFRLQLRDVVTNDIFEKCIRLADITLPANEEA